MEELQLIFSKWSIVDLNTVLRLSNGDFELAIHRISEQDRTGLPVEMLIRSLSNDVRTRQHYDYNGQKLWQRHQAGRGVVQHPSASSFGLERTLSGGGRRRRTFSSPNATTTISSTGYSQFFHHTDTEQAPRNAGATASRVPGHAKASRIRQYNMSNHNGQSDAVPSIIQIDSKSWEYPEPHRPQEPHQARLRSPLDEARPIPPSSLSSPPEDLLRQLSPDQKDQLLRQLLSTRGQLGTDTQQVRQGEARIRGNTKNDLSRREMDMINVQFGILMSHKREEGARRNYPPLSEENVNEEAMNIGIQKSKQEFRQHCRKQDQDEAIERALVEKAKTISLHYPSASMSRAEECMIKEVKRESLVEEEKRKSLASSRFMYIDNMEELMLEEVTRKSLASPPRMTKEDHLIEEVKRESLESLECRIQDENALEGTQSLPPESSTLQLLGSGKRKSSRSTVTTSRLTDDDTSMDILGGPSFMPMREESEADSLSLSISDRKPPPVLEDHQAGVNDDSIPRAVLRDDFSLPFGGGHFGGYDVGIILPRLFRKTPPKEN